MAESIKKSKKEDQAEGTSGIKAVLEQSLQSYEKLPMLEIIFERFIKQLSTSLRNLTSESVDITVEDHSSTRFSAYFESIKGPYSIVIFKVVEWENFGLIVLENDVIFSFVDLLLGGKKNNLADEPQDEARTLTSIEQGLARQISETVLTELSYAFDQISPTTFMFERLENNPNFVNIARAGDAVISLRLKIEIDEQVKRLHIMLPYKTIEPIKQQMQQIFLGDEFGHDHEWERRLVSSVSLVDLPLEAVISNKTSTLKEIANLKIGDTLITDHPKDGAISLQSGEVKLFTGKVGKVDNKIAINIKTIAEE